MNLIFNPILYIIFLLVSFTLIYFSKNEFKKYILLILGFIFYSYWDWRFLFILLLTALNSFLFGKIIFNTIRINRKRIILISSISISIGLLCFFKYADVLSSSFLSVFGYFGYQMDSVHLNLIIPLGISYFTFSSLTYQFDIYRGSMKPSNSFFDVVLFVSYFPIIIAGPIEKASRIIPQIEYLRTPKFEEIKIGISYITIGMFKKVLIGDPCGKIVDQIFFYSKYYDGSELIMGLLLLTVQIYADFSGYSNIASGTSKLFGIKIIDNFNQPYFSKSISEFWRRWHISLSNWFKEYIFFPLTFSFIRKLNFIKVNKEILAYCSASLITFALIGLWHGAGWNFLIWGVLQGVVINYELVKKEYDKRHKIKSKIFNYKINNSLKIFRTMIIVVISWLIFRTTTPQETSNYIWHIFNNDFGDFWLRCLKISVSFIFIIYVLDYLEIKYKTIAFMNKIKSNVKIGISIAIWLFIILYLLQSSPSPFIYQQF